MDNAIDALKIAFSVFVFVMALSISMRVFSQAKAVSDEVFYMTDKTNFYEYTSDNEKEIQKIAEGRIVSGETIIPTLYRYYKENFNIIIGEDKNGDNVVSGENEVLWEFNLEKEIEAYNHNYASAPWLGNANIDTKRRVDIEVEGIIGEINNQEYKTPQWKKAGVGILEYVSRKKIQRNF